MANSYAKLDSALKELIEAFSEVEEDLDEKFGEDEEAYTSALIEALETSVEGAIDDQDSSTTTFASILSTLTEALENLDPTAFEGASSEDEEEEEETDYEIDDVDYDELDEDDDEDEDEE